MTQILKQRETKISHFMKVDVQCADTDSKEESSQSHTLQSTPIDCLDLLPHLKMTVWTNANSIFADSSAVVATCSRGVARI